MKRINIFCGHYGSGKTNIAINYAFYLKGKGLSVSIADIDIVNPYFRTKDSEGELEAEGIRVISLPFANTNVDLPALPAEVYSLVQNKNEYAVFDVGGDDRGAYALGRYVPYILEENNFNMFFVVNFYRPLTQTAQEALEVMREIEGACGIPFTGIINNSNLGEETTKEDILRTAEETKKLCEISGLPLEFTCCEESTDLESAFKLKLQKKIF